jgi:hypothetical protein
VITPTDAAAEEFLATAQRVLRADPGPGAFDALDGPDLLDGLDDRLLRFALIALLRAQGRELADTPAVGLLLAVPYREVVGEDAAGIVAAITVTSPRTGERALVLGDAGDRDVLVHRAGRRPTLYPAAAARPRAVAGRLTVREVDLTHPARTVTEEARDCRAEAVRLGRIALAAEMLGAAEGAVALALEHARIREQFGEPIGRFQAVRHLLAWAETDTVALAATIRQAAWGGFDALPAHDDEVIKALAGRNARRACEHALQVLGGIGFTAEHDHHHHHGRVLLLDSLLGTSARLTRRLGTRVRETGSTPPLLDHALAGLDA